MQPIYPYVAVEKIEDEKSTLELVIDQKPVVKIIAVPDLPADVSGYSNGLYVGIGVKEGQNILVNHVDEYMVDGEKAYFVRIRDIVAIV